MRVIDPLSHIRTHPEMYMGESPLRGTELARRLTGDAVMLGARQVFVAHDRGWWAIAADMDWLSSCPGVLPGELFRRVLPLPQAGVNSMRSEILLAAFADDVLVLAPGESHVIKGDAVAPEQLPSPPSGFHWVRMVAFRVRDKA